MTTPAHASEADGRGVVVDVRADDRIRAASIPPTHAPARELATCQPHLVSSTRSEIRHCGGRSLSRRDDDLVGAGGAKCNLDLAKARVARRTASPAPNSKVEVDSCKDPIGFRMRQAGAGVIFRVARFATVVF